MSRLRDFIVCVDGFDFTHVYARAISHGQAKYLCARGFREAGFGSWRDGFAHIRSVRLYPDGEGLPLVESTRLPGGGGLLYGGEE